MIYKKKNKLIFDDTCDSCLVLKMWEKFSLMTIEEADFNCMSLKDLKMFLKAQIDRLIIKTSCVLVY